LTPTRAFGEKFVSPASLVLLRVLLRACRLVLTRISALRLGYRCGRCRQYPQWSRWWSRRRSRSCCPSRCPSAPLKGHIFRATAKAGIATRAELAKLVQQFNQ